MKRLEIAWYLIKDSCTFDNMLYKEKITGAPQEPLCECVWDCHGNLPKSFDTKELTIIVQHCMSLYVIYSHYFHCFDSIMTLSYIPSQEYTESAVLYSPLQYFTVSCREIFFNECDFQKINLVYEGIDRDNFFVLRLVARFDRRVLYA